MSQVQKALYLRLFYYQKMFGERYIDNINIEPTQEKLNIPMVSLEDTIAHCALCDRSKNAKPSFGILPSEAKIVFISQLPLVDSSKRFIEGRSAKMLQDIISNVFMLNPQECGILSVVKCNQNDLNAPDSDMLICKQYLSTQLSLTKSKVIILMGDVVCRHLLGMDFNEHKGRIISEDNKSYLATYSLNQLLKNPSLKKEAMKHFLLAKGIL